VGLVEGGDSYLESIAALWRLAPDMHIDARFELACERHGVVWALKGIGTLPEGGTFERPIVMVLIVAGGRITRVEVFEPEDVDAALARCVGLRPSATRDPLAVLAKPNAATVARDRVEAAFEARAWAALRALCVADAKHEDRRRHVLVSYDVDGWIADRQRWAQAGVHQERRLVRTVGDRVAIERIVGTSGPPDGRVEVEYLSLVEVDES